MFTFGAFKLKLQVFIVGTTITYEAVNDCVRY